MPNHFAYLSEKQASVSPDQLLIFAKTASRRFIDEQVPLNTTIKKLASDNDLNPHQVERVCEMANLATHQALWPAAKEKEKVAFEVADPKAIIEKGKERPSSKMTRADEDYKSPPRKEHGGGSLSGLLGVDPSACHHGLAEGNDKQKVIIIIEKKAAERERVRAQLLVAGMEYETVEKLAYHQVKQAVLGGYSFRQVFDAASAAGLGKIAKHLLPEFEQRLIKETYGDTKARLEKNAISKAPEDLISDNLDGMTIVNGAHPVLISLDTVKRQDGKVQALLSNVLHIDDELKIHRQKLSELNR